MEGVAAAIAAVAALAGVVLGRMLDRWSESTNWIREHRSIAYAAFLGAVEQYLTGAVAAVGDPDFRASAHGMELDRIHGDLQVFGSEPARLAADEVHQKSLDLHATRSQEDRQDLTAGTFEIAATAALEECRASLARLRAIMKNELHVR